jgi:hypothetical protein
LLPGNEVSANNLIRYQWQENRGLRVTPEACITWTKIRYF